MALTRREFLKKSGKVALLLGAGASLENCATGSSLIIGSADNEVNMNPSPIYLEAIQKEIRKLERKTFYEEPGE